MDKNENTVKTKGFLGLVERAGNKLPHPVALFAILAAFIAVLSWLLSLLNVSATGMLVSGGELQETTVGTVNLLSGEGIAWMFTSAVSNFTGYAPLGTVLVAMLGVGVAEQSGLINAMLKRTVQVTPKAFITPVVVFLGVLSNIASDAGYVVLIPLGAMIFRAYGKHPIAGLAAAFAGVSGGFSANLLVGTLDPLLTGISQEAASIISTTYTVNVLGNYWFMAASTFLITIVGTLVTNSVEKRLGTYDGTLHGEEDASLRDLTSVEKKGLNLAGISTLIFIILIIGTSVPSNSFFRNADGEILGSPTSPLISSVVILIALLFFIPAVVFGKVTGTFGKGTKDACVALGKAMASMGGYVALAFVAAQFIAYFNYTKLGTILAITGANFFESVDIGLIPLMVLFVLFSAFINLFMGSASAKWNIMAPVFVPMFMLLGYSPELAQLAFRIGDSSTNLITPLMSYYAIIVVCAQRYDKKAGIGTLTATMLPYSIAFLVTWTLLLIVWLALRIPIGIDTGLFFVA